MPNYDFNCKVCNLTVELQDTALPPCPTCGETMVRVWSAPAVKFNASGFYSTGG